MEKVDFLILKYLSQGLKIGDIPKQLEDDESIITSKSSIEKRLTIIKKLCGAKTPFHLAVIAKERKLI
ncbi:hypothetical protein NG800_014055 [Epilithonimonas ginsengisoli]|uniref:Uncharacterized protein n=2 Tax=Chryseobacterium group TaxID=2782232 RepID=A0AAD0YL67_CHRNA|nr:MULTISPECIES: hypothetical protein [Chryseobacterium group]SHM24424.1 hypothetical protein SAMN05444360_109153 [Chryseobacterium carnipullorum]AZA89858.1 hypothetical protein EG343_04055 [Chryseobacterium nakagawai]MBV6880437.1 hypothetical protein [Epilithonimonas sp. FP105]MDW8550045.1 hypothetical protein [Epilithonimonas ginsengisoli]OAH69225.1 hypothetical protein AXA65_15485 [Chryseobacterium sp. FP211-J200]